MRMRSRMIFVQNKQNASSAFSRLYSQLKHHIKFYGMASFETFANSSTLNVVVLNLVLEFPPQDSTWVRKLRSDKVERE